VRPRPHGVEFFVEVIYTHEQTRLHFTTAVQARRHKETPFHHCGSGPSFDDGPRKSLVPLRRGCLLHPAGTFLHFALTSDPRVELCLRGHIFIVRWPAAIRRGHRGLRPTAFAACGLCGLRPSQAAAFAGCGLRSLGPVAAARIPLSRPAPLATRKLRGFRPSQPGAVAACGPQPAAFEAVVLPLTTPVPVHHDLRVTACSLLFVDVCLRLMTYGAALRSAFLVVPTIIFLGKPLQSYRLVSMSAPCHLGS
jgi:hypothetical protein